MDLDARTFRDGLATALRAEFAIQQLAPRDVAPRMGLHHQTVRRSLAADRDVTAYELSCFADLLGTTREALYAQAMEFAARAASKQQEIQRRTDSEIG